MFSGSGRPQEYENKLQKCTTRRDTGVRLAFFLFCRGGKVYVCWLMPIKAKPMLRFDFAGSHIERSEARIAKLAISRQLSAKCEDKQKILNRRFSLINADNWLAILARN